MNVHTKLFKLNSKGRLLRFTEALHDGKSVYRMFFDVTTGAMERHIEDDFVDTEASSIPEIADIEITTKCNGGCAFCYKSNTPQGTNMSLEKFKAVFSKLPEYITQIAFGVDYDLTANPEALDIIEFTRSKGVVPNLTVGEVNNETAERLSKQIGAIAISLYNIDTCFNTVKLMANVGVKQVNIHAMISQETYSKTMEALTRISQGELPELNAIVFLSLKQKGRGANHNILSRELYTGIIDFCMKHNIPFGFDSCGAHKFQSYVHSLGITQFDNNIEPCESTLYSLYIDVHGKFHPCSFAQSGEHWGEGLDVASCENFINDIWLHPSTKKFRQTLINNKRHCPFFRV